MARGDNEKRWLRPEIILPAASLIGLAFVEHYRLLANEVRDEKEHAVFAHDHEVLQGLATNMFFIRQSLDELKAELMKKIK